MKPREWGLLSRLCRELLQACGNPLFSEVYARFNRYSHLPFFFTCDDSPLRAQMDWHGDFFTALENRNIQEKYNWLTASYLRTADAVRMSLNLLEAEYRGVVLPPAEPFSGEDYMGTIRSISRSHRILLPRSTPASIRWNSIFPMRLNSPKPTASP